MQVKLSKIAETVLNQISPVREIMSFANPKILKEYGIEQSDFISFGGGWVNHKAPKELQNIYSSIAVDDEAFHLSGGYSPTTGENDCKDAIIKFEEEIFRVEGLKPENILIGQSSTQLTYFLFKMLLDETDKICFLDPTYCNYPLQVNIACNAEIIYYPIIDKDSFEYLGHSKEYANKYKEFLLEHKPKVIWLVSPDNPSGKVVSTEIVNAAHEAAREYGGVVVIDFAYKTIVFRDYPEYFKWAPDDNLIFVHSNSKWGRGLGRRLGWIEASPYMISSFETLHSASVLCPDKLHQMVFTNYIEETTRNGRLKEYIEKTNELYKQTAKVTVDAIEEYIGYNHTKPDGGLYTVMQVGKNSARFVQDVLKNTGVLFIPGWGFGSSLAYSVRLSYGPLVYNHDRIVEGIKRVSKYLGK